MLFIFPSLIIKIFNEFYCFYLSVCLCIYYVVFKKILCFIVKLFESISCRFFISRAYNKYANVRNKNTDESRVFDILVLSFYMFVFCCCCFNFSVEFYNGSNMLLRPINETLSIPSYQEKCFLLILFISFSLILSFAKNNHNLLIFPTTDFILFNIQFLKWNYIWFKLQKIHRMRNTYKNMSFMRHIIIFNL